MSSIFDIFKKLDAERAAQNAAPFSHIIVGLGNPGDKYHTTRHNAGFLSIDYIAEKCGATVNRSRFKALVGECRLGGERVLLMKPQTFMNLSGEAVREAAAFYKISPECISVICDDINFDVGKMRIRRKGSAGGHNGLKSIIEQLGSDAFVRVKVGVGKKPSPEYDLADFVLSNFNKEEKETLFQAFESIYLAEELIVSGKIDEAMNKYSK